ncbi:hypothetical protein [Streptomyces sp. 2A115]|uniref:hypothetical protein n=1 Tax=Streptomyces sp. 2A115 TaxID=3457439 RepID=UPI003FD39ECA
MPNGLGYGNAGEGLRHLVKEPQGGELAPGSITRIARAALVLLQLEHDHTT